MRKVEDFVFGMIATPVLWLFASYLDVIAHNLSNHSYAWWNLFSLFF